jgi:RHS repeat-associated protein
MRLTTCIVPRVAVALLLATELRSLAQDAPLVRLETAPSAARPAGRVTTAAPVVIEWPPDGAYLKTPSAAVRVAASDEVLSVSVNGVSAARDFRGTFVADPVELPEGPVVLTARGMSRDGKTWTASVKVTADRTPPRITILNRGATLEAGAALRGPVKPVITAEDRSPVHVQALLNGAPFTLGSQIAADGSYTLDVEASDRAGNVSRKTVVFRVDSRPPALTRLSPADGSVLRGERVSVSGECEDAVSVTVGGVAASIYGGRFVARDVPLAPGRNTLPVVATDAAGNERVEPLVLVRDDVAPRLTISTPATGALVRNASVMVRGTAEDPNLTEVLVNRSKATLSGSSFEREVRLSEGANRLTVVARDAAGNCTETTLDVTLDSTAPTLVIFAPLSGSVLAAREVEVAGEAVDADLMDVVVNGVRAEVLDGRFHAKVGLVTGSNVVRVSAVDRAGNSSSASASITRDDTVPVLAVDALRAVTARAPLAEVTGSVEGDGATVNVNGVRTEVSGGRFRVSGLKLTEGAHTIEVRATSAAGKTAVFNAALSVDTTLPEVVLVDPADGAIALPGAVVPRVRFSEAISPSSANASTVRLLAGEGGPVIPATVRVSGREVSLLPLSPLPERAALRVEISSAVVDLAGNPLRAPFTGHFTTSGASAPARPRLDPLPSALCGRAVTVSGATDPGARVRIEGGERPESAVARPDGTFVATVALHPESANALRLQAFDDQGRGSELLELALRSDCTPPRVEQVAYRDGRLEVGFSEPIDPRTLKDGSIRVVPTSGGTPFSVSARLASDGRTAVIADPDGTLAGGARVSVEPGVADLAGNPLPTAHVASLAASRTFLAGTTGGLSGQVFDDRVGRPLPGVTVTVVAVNGAAPTPPAPTAVTDADGRFSFVVPIGDVAVRASLDAYTATTRVSTVVADQSGAVFDVRLTPETLVSAAADGSADVTDREVRLTLPAAAVAAGTTVRVSSLSPQGLPFLPPLGWSPAGSLSFELGAVTNQPPTVTNLPSAATATIANRFAYPSGTTLLIAKYDAATRRYLRTGTATLGTGAATIQASVTSTGQWLVLVPDPAPNAPAQPAVGQPFTGLATPGSDPIVSATVASVPSDVLPTQSADVTATLTLSANAPSGYPVQVLVSETLTLVNAQQVQVPSFLENLTLLRDGTGKTIVPFRVRPSATAAQVALSVGYENLVVKHYTFDLRRGNLIGSAGGAVTGPLGFTLVVPANALTQTVPVNMTQVSGAAELPIAIPTGYVYKAAVRVDFSGQTLTAPATLRWASTTDPTGSGLVWVEAATLNAVSRARFAGPGRYDATNKWAETTPAAVHNLPVSGVVRSGLYVLLSATAPLAYVKGRVLDVDGTTPVASAIVTEDANAIVAVSDGLGNWSLPVPAAGTIARSARVDTGNVGQVTVPAQAAGATATADVRLSVTAPYVLSVAPATSSPLPLDLPVVFTLSEPLSPATVSNTSVTATSGGFSIGGTVTLSPSGTQVTFTPNGSWPGKSSVTLVLSSTVTDWHGYRLVDRVTRATSDYTVTYVTIDPTPPVGVNPLLISVSLPSGTPPTITITGSPGAACGGCRVTAVNDTTAATASTTALSNGSFTLTLAAALTDRVYIVIRLTTGADLYVNPGPFRADGGRVAFVTDRAADYVTQDAIHVTFADRTFDVPTVLTIAPIDEASLPLPVPTLGTFIAGIDFDPGDGVVAKKPINIGVPAPTGVTGGQFFLAKAVDLNGEKRWMVVDVATVVNGEITTKGGGGSSLNLVLPAGSGRAALTSPTQDPFMCPAPPNDCCPNPPACQYPKNLLDRAVQKSQLVLMKMEATFAFIAGVVGQPNLVCMPDFSATFTTLQGYVPFAWDWRQARERDFFALPVPMGYDFTLVGSDGETGLTVFQSSFPAVTDPNNVTPLPSGPLAPKVPAPRLLSASPFLAKTFVPATTASHAVHRPLLPNIEYSYVVTSGVGALRVYGAAEAVDTCTKDAANNCARFVQLSLVNNVRTLAPVTATAAADGSFGQATAFELALNPGEDATFLAGTLSLTPTSKIRLVFTRDLDPDALKPDVTFTDTGTAVDFDLEGDAQPTSRGLTVLTSRAFAGFDPANPSLHNFTLALLGGAGHKLPQSLSVTFSGRSTKLIGSRNVRNVNALFLKGALLFEVTAVGGNAGDVAGTPAKLNMYDASDPAAPLPLCSSKPLYDEARGVTADDHDRVIVSMGGGGTNGRVEIFRLSPFTSTAASCGGRVLLGDGDASAAGVLDRSFTEITVHAGAGNLGVLPEGFPRKTEILYREVRQTITLDSETGLPTFVTQMTKTDVLPTSAPDGKQDPNSPLTIVGKLPPNPNLPSPPNPPQSAYPSPLNQPVTVVNHTTGRSWTQYADVQGNFTIVATASSGDLLEFRMNAAEFAIVGTMGFGLQGVDLDKTLHFNGQDCRPGGTTNELCDAEKRIKFSFGRDDTRVLCRSPLDASGQCPDSVPTLELLNDIVLLPSAEDALPGALPATADPDEKTVLASVSHFGLAAFTVTGALEQVSVAQLGTGIPVGTFEIPPQYPNFFGLAAVRGFPVKPVGERRYCSGTLWPDYRPTLAFLASSVGVFVVDVTNAKSPGYAGPSPYGDPEVVGFFRYPSASGVSTVFADASRGLLYVGINGTEAGVAVYDMTDPCTTDVNLYPNREAQRDDPRRIAYVPITGLDVNVPYVIDPDTGVVFTGGDGATPKAFSLSLFPPPLRFVADTNRDGQWEAVDRTVPLGLDNPDKPSEPVPASHDPYPPDVVRVMANIMGKAGSTIVVDVYGASDSGLPGPPLPPGFPRTRSNVELKRQSDDPADPGYNRYLSPPIVLIADPRAQKRYALSDPEKDSKLEFSCHNCQSASDYAGELGTLSAVPPAAGDNGQPPIQQAYEQWMGEKLVVVLAKDATAETAINTKATYLASVDLKAVRSEIRTTRADLAPGVRQAPRLNPSVVGDEAGSEVVVSSGELRTSDRDLFVASRGVDSAPDFALDRFYVSQALHFGPLGQSWDSPLFARLRPLPNGDVDYYDGSGRRETFRFKVKDGVKSFEPPPGRFAELSRLPDLTFFLREKNNTRFQFDANGRLTSMYDAVRTIADPATADGNNVRLLYDGAGRLTVLQDTLDHEIKFVYYADTVTRGQPTPDGAGDPCVAPMGGYPGLLKTVTDHMGREVRYCYDDKARLRGVALPEIHNLGVGADYAGTARRLLKYNYDDAAPLPSADLKRSLQQVKNLLVTQNARGGELLNLTYADGFGNAANDSVTTRKIGGVAETFTYAAAARTARLTDRRGHNWDFEHDADGHATAVTLFANDTGDANPPNAILGAFTVGPGVVPVGPFRTTFAYTKDGSTTTTGLPSGRSVVKDYPTLTAADTDRRKRGNPISVTVAGGGISLTDTYDYHALVNQVISHKDPLGVETTFDRDPQKGFVNKVNLPQTVGVDPNSPPKPGVDITRDPDTGQPRVQTDKAGVSTTIDPFPKGDPAYGYVQKTTDMGVDASVVTFARDARGNVLSKTDPRGIVFNYQVNEADQVVKVTIPSAGVTDTFEYDADGNLVKETWAQTPLAQAPARTYTYDALGRRTNMTEGGLIAAAATTHFDYNSAGSLIATTLPENEIDLTIYDARGLAVGQVRRNADGTTTAVTTLKRDEDGRVLETFDGVNTRTTVTRVDGAGRPDRISTPRGAEVQVTYDSVDRVTDLVVVDPTSNNAILKQLHTDYAPNGQVETQTETILDPLKTTPLETATSRFAYDAGERLVRTTDPLNRVTLRDYDDHGRLRSLVDPVGNSTLVKYDKGGYPIERHSFEKNTDASASAEPERVDYAGYDALGRQTQKTDPLGHVTQATYDQVGNVLWTQDALTHKTTFGYDDRGRRTSMTDPVGKTTTWVWDRSSRQTSLIDANTRETKYVYDKIGRLTEIDYPDGAKEYRSWNGDGTLATQKDANGSIATFTYGPDDQPEGIAYTRATGVVGVTSETFAYDKLGRMTSASSNGGLGGSTHTTGRTYDSKGRMTTEVQDGKTLAREFDLAGNPKAVTYPNSKRRFERHFDGLNRVDAIDEVDLVATTRKLVRATDHVGDARPSTGATQGFDLRYDYDLGRRLTAITTTNHATQAQLLKNVLAWADDDVPLYEKRVHEANRGDVFVHDADHRLTTAGLSQTNPDPAPPAVATPDPANKQVFSLGFVHERTNDTLTLAGVANARTVTPNLRYGYTAYGATTQTYDLAGNLTGRGTDTFKWDAKHRLVEANLAGGVKVEFGYDALNRRVERRKTVGANVTTQTFVFDGWNTVEESRNGVLFRNAVFDLGLDTEVQFRLFGSPNRDYDLFRDENGSTSALVRDDGQTQLLKYLPFGKISLLAAPGTYNFSLTGIDTGSLWQGLEFDPDLGWYYARNRWYDPETGVFTSADPLGYPDSANAYAWGISSPWPRDPMGLFSLGDAWQLAKDAGKIVGAAAAGVVVGAVVAAAATVSAPVVLTAVVAYGAYSATKAGIDRWGAGQTVGESILGGAADALGVSSLVAGISDRDVATGNKLNLTHDQRVKALQGGAFAIGALAGGVKTAKTLDFSDVAQAGMEGFSEAVGELGGVRGAPIRPAPSTPLGPSLVRLRPGFEPTPNRGGAPGSRPFKDFTRAGRDEVLQRNAMEQPDGVARCINPRCMIELEEALQSKKGQTPSPREAQVDHYDPRAQGGSGDPSNGGALCRACNIKFSDKPKPF